MEDDGGLVDKSFACPFCGEQHMDNLVFDDEGVVNCTVCGTRYRIDRSKAHGDRTFTLVIVEQRPVNPPGDRGLGTTEQGATNDG